MKQADPKTAPLLSVLIVSFNTKALTLACLQSLFRETQATDIEVIVVDNGSRDGSADAIALDFPQVKLVRSEANRGFGPANNLAARQAKGRYLLLLNSDTVILDGAVDRLVSFAQGHPGAQIWGGRTVFADGSLNPSSCWRHMSLWSLWCHATGLTRLFRASDLFNREAYGGWKRDTERNVAFVSGCFLMITRDLWAVLEGFDERFFMYAEEADLCRRAEARGASPLVSPRATIIHHGGKSEVAQVDKLVKLFAGRMTFAIKHWSPARAAAGRSLMILHCRVRAWAESLGAGLIRSGGPNQVWTAVLRQGERWKNGYPVNMPVQPPSVETPKT